MTQADVERALKEAKAEIVKLERKKTQFLKTAGNEAMEAENDPDVDNTATKAQQERKGNAKSSSRMTRQQRKKASDNKREATREMKRKSMPRSSSKVKRNRKLTNKEHRAAEAKQHSQNDVAELKDEDSDDDDKIPIAKLLRKSGNIDEMLPDPAGKSGNIDEGKLDDDVACGESTASISLPTFSVATSIPAVALSQLTADDEAKEEGGRSDKQVSIKPVINIPTKQGPHIVQIVRKKTKKHTKASEEEEEVEWEIPAVPEKPSDPIYLKKKMGHQKKEIVKPMTILNHRKAKGWLGEVFIGYSNGEEGWSYGLHAAMEELPPGIFHKYMKTENLTLEMMGYKNNDNPDYAKLKKKEKIQIKQFNHEANSLSMDPVANDDGSIDASEQIGKCTIDHLRKDNLYCFQTMQDSRYCQKDQKYFNTKCANHSCKRAFIHHFIKGESKLEYFKPSTNMPMYVCPNNNKCNCLFAFCSDCFLENLESADSLSGK